MVRTFLDRGVLLAAVRSLGRDRERALQVLEDPDRSFLTSPFVHLELVPKAIFHKRVREGVYDEYFNAAEWFRDLDKIEAAAQVEAAKSGLAAMDALHLAAANLSQADEFITTERPGKPIYRTSRIRIVHLCD
ncbi:MAG: nucleic acid-binding protein [Acidobacteria bacterium]|nr:nucleic acid-binding protein [Acidobacteriota bacterium]